MHHHDSADKYSPIPWLRRGILFGRWQNHDDGNEIRRDVSEIGLTAKQERAKTLKIVLKEFKWKSILGTFPMSVRKTPVSAQVPDFFDMSCHSIFEHQICLRSHPGGGNQIIFQPRPQPQLVGLVLWPSWNETRTNVEPKFKGWNQHQHRTKI